MALTPEQQNAKLEAARKSLLEQQEKAREAAKKPNARRAAAGKKAQGGKGAKRKL